MTAPSNVWHAECEPLDGADGVRGARLLERPRGTRLVAAVWELDPGASSPHYHLHHTTEELLCMLDGDAILRTPSGERAITRGEVVHFPTGAAGAHQVHNRSDAVVRYLMTAAHGATDMIEYVDERRVVVYSHRESLLQSDSLSFTHDVALEP